MTSIRHPGFHVLLEPQLLQFFPQGLRMPLLHRGKSLQHTPRSRVSRMICGGPVIITGFDLILDGDLKDILQRQFSPVQPIVRWMWHGLTQSCR